MFTLAKSNEPRISVLADAIHRAIQPMAFGTVVPYADFHKILFEDPQGNRGRRAILRAAKQLLCEDHKLLINVRGKGYQIAQPNEHVGQANRLQTLARRRLRKALAVIVHAEMEQLLPKERQQINEQANRLRLKLALDTRLTHAKALPGSTNTKLPTGKELARLLTMVT